MFPLKVNDVICISHQYDKVMKTTFLLICIILIVGKKATANEFCQQSDSIYSTVDKVPIYKRNRGSIQKYLAKNIKYPVDAVAKEIEGKVLVSFVITQEGKLVNAQIVEGLYVSIDEEALRVIRTAQEWKPGMIDGSSVATKVTIPVHFILLDESKKIAQKLKPFYANDKPPLFVLDKKMVTGLTNLEYYNIKSIRVMKGEKAIALYGEKAANGVVIFETKRGTSPDYQMY